MGRRGRSAEKKEDKRMNLRCVGSQAGHGASKVIYLFLRFLCSTSSPD